MKTPRMSAGIVAVILALFTSFAALFMCVPALAEETPEMQTVKVAVLNHTTFASQDENGIWSGTDVEYMISVAQKAGFRLEFIDSANDPDFLGNLENGTYDIVADVVKTPEREEKYLFTDEAIGSINNTLAVRAEDSRWDYGNIDQIAQMKIGVLSSYANNADFRKWCQKHGFTASIREYENIEKMTAGLKTGEVDGEVYSAVYGEQYTAEFRTILKFLPESYYFAFRKDDIALKNRVDAAIAQILTGNVDFLTTLKNKYDIRYGNNILPLSAAERTYIEKHPVITVAVIQGDDPYYKKNPDGSDGGIIPDYYRLLAEHTGFSFQYAVYPTFEEMIDGIGRKEADVIGLYGDGLISAYQNGLSLTDSIATVNAILLTKPGRDIDGIGRIAVRQRTQDAAKNNADSFFPHAEMVRLDNARECFRRLVSGDADALLVGMPSATWLINQTNSTSYSIIPVSGITFDLCGAVRPTDQTLCSILNKGVAATRGNFTGITTRDTLPQNDWKTTISRIPPVLTIVVLAALLILVAGLIWTIVQLRRRQKERAAVMAAQSAAEQQRIRAEASEKNAEEKNMFFSNISHDMRTPLNAVIGFAGLGEKEESPEKKNEYFGKIRSSGELLNSLIDDTLTISKINSGKLELHPEPLRLSELVNGIVDSVQQAAGLKKIVFTVDDAGIADDMIMADRLNVQKIFLNLLSNAIKFTGEGGHVGLHIFSDPREAADPDTVIEISDDGIGIGDDFLPHVFEPFAQERRLGYESVGTGLGLSIVRQLVSLMKGTITVQSVKDRGTTFTVRLHFDSVDPGLLPAAGAAPEKNAALAGGRLLLCEDNQLNREIAVALLKAEGFEVDLAENGQEGVERFAQSAEGEYRAVLMDIRMPVMDGIEATRAIRALKNRSDARTVPIIAMTADAFAEDIRRCTDAGMNGHIAKPVDPQKLHRVLTEAILNTPGQQSS